jgi:hypothetical protein
MKNSSYAGHSFGRGSIELLNFAIRDRRLDRDRIKQSRKVEVRGVVRHSAYFQWAIYARCLATDR